MCIIADDSIFLTIAVAHLARASNVISLFPGLQDKGEQYLQAVAASNDYSMDCIKVLKKRNLALTLQDTHHRKVMNATFVHILHGIGCGCQVRE